MENNRLLLLLTENLVPARFVRRPALMPLSPAGDGLYLHVDDSLVSTLVNDGASFTGLTVMLKVQGALVSTPPLAVPPLSCRPTVTVALLLALRAGV